MRLTKFSNLALLAPWVLTMILRVGQVSANLVVVDRASKIIKEDHYSLANMLFDDGCDMTYDPYLVSDVGAAFSVNYTDPGGSGMDAYVSGAVGGVKSGGRWRPGNKTLTQMPLRIQDLDYDFRIKWKVSQENAWDADDKWWATINVIFDSATEFSEPQEEDRLFDIVIELDRYEQYDHTDLSKNDANTYWWFARNDDGTIRPFVLNIDGVEYEWGVRYKFFQNQGWKNNKVHVKFIPMDNNNVAPYLDHPLRDFVETAKDYLPFCLDMGDAEVALANEKVAEPSLWIKAIAAGYETYQGSSILKQDELRVISDVTPPVAPTNLTGSALPMSIALHWDDHQDEPLHGYSVWRSDNGGAFSELSNNVHERSFVDIDVSPGILYSYYVKAVDRSYNFSPSSIAVTAMAMDAPSSAPTTTPTDSPVPTPTLPQLNPTATPTTLEDEPGPGPSPRPPTTGAGCFSERNTVEVKGKGPTLMNQLQIGDEVRVGNGDFSRVYSFGHRDANAVDLHMRIFHSSSEDQPLELTPKHIVFVDGRGSVTADKIVVGDKLFGASGGPFVVTKIVQEYSRGLYAPFTFSGDIVVNGVLASNYVAFLDKSVIDHHTMNHAYLTPLRIRCRIDPSFCSSETYVENGVSDIYAPSMRLLGNTKTSGGWLHFVLSGVAYPTLFTLRFIEQVYDEVIFLI